MYAGAIAAALSGYPAGVVAECIDPRVGLARGREFPPTVAAVVAWCDDRLCFYRNWATYIPRLSEPERPPISAETSAKIGKLLVELAATLRVKSLDRQIQK
jgi:hypothetical protein